MLLPWIWWFENLYACLWFSIVPRSHRPASLLLRGWDSGDLSAHLPEAMRLWWGCSCSHQSRSSLGSHSSPSSRRVCSSTRPSAGVCRSPVSLEGRGKTVLPATKSNDWCCIEAANFCLIVALPVISTPIPGQDVASMEGKEWEDRPESWDW